MLQLSNSNKLVFIDNDSEIEYNYIDKFCDYTNNNNDYPIVDTLYNHFNNVYIYQIKFKYYIKYSNNETILITIDVKNIKYIFTIFDILIVFCENKVYYGKDFTEYKELNTYLNERTFISYSNHCIQYGYKTHNEIKELVCLFTVNNVYENHVKEAKIFDSILLAFNNVKELKNNFLVLTNGKYVYFNYLKLSYFYNYYTKLYNDYTKKVILDKFSIFTLDSDILDQNTNLLPTWLFGIYYDKELNKYVYLNKKNFKIIEDCRIPIIQNH